MARDIIRDVIADTQREFPGLRTLVEESRLPEAAQTAHRVRGGLLNLGAARTCDRLLKLEEACKADQSRTAREELARAEEAFLELRRELEL
jgi:HPt (histidine-containing phosphotransfer) domain-containing protein